MLESIKRLLARVTRHAEGDAIAGWARRAGHVYKREKDGDGFAIDGQFDGKPWRLEWGRPQRTYIEGHELRMRMVLGIPPDLQMLLMTKPLARAARQGRVRAGDPDQPDLARRHHRRGDALAGRVPPDLALRLADPAQLLRRRLEPAARGPGLARGTALARPRARRRELAERAAAVPADDAARPHLPAPAARQRRRAGHRRRGHAVRHRRRVGAARRASPRRRAGRLVGIDHQRLAVAATRRRSPQKGAPKEPAPSSRRKGSEAGKEQLLSARCVGTCVRKRRAWKSRYACRPSSIFAIALRCTSSGPSAKRRVRAPA